jgi:hypothetical protein
MSRLKTIGDTSGTLASYFGGFGSLFHERSVGEADCGEEPADYTGYFRNPAAVLLDFAANRRYLAALLLHGRLQSRLAIAKNRLLQVGDGFLALIG